MSLLNITCPICTDPFNNADDVHSTICGHLFHIACLNDWRSRDSSCPQCRCHDPKPHKLFLNFDETGYNMEEVNEMEVKLKSSNEKIIELQVKNSEAEINFMKLQSQFTAANDEKRVLEEQIRQMMASEENFMQLQAQYTESTELLKDLEDRFKLLVVVNERKTKELQLKTIENESLKASQGADQSVSSDNGLKLKIKMFEQKLQTISKQLENEINTCTQLSIEKMKLESYIKNMTVKNKEEPTTAEQIVKGAQNNKKRNKQKPSVSTQNRDDGPRNRCIFIQNLPRYIIVNPLEFIIINLAVNIEMSITAKDLLKVSFFDESQTKLCAEFRNSDLKEQFLAKKNLLKKNKFLKDIIINEYMDGEVIELYKYAKEKLKGNGFSCVYCSNNKIYAKSYKDKGKVLQIKSKNEVDDLQKQSNANESVFSMKSLMNLAMIDDLH